MIIAQQKRKENIGEYILYMWQIEDTLRALDFDLQKIQTYLIDRYDVSIEMKHEIKGWYENLIAMMKQEAITERGHIQAVFNLITDLNDIHKYLLKTPAEGKYQQLFHIAQTDISTLREAQIASDSNDIEICMNFLYGILLLRLKKEKISEDTNVTVERVSKLIALLASKHKDIEEGKIELDI